MAEGNKTWHDWRAHDAMITKCVDTCFCREGVAFCFCRERRLGEDVVFFPKRRLAEFAILLTLASAIVGMTNGAIVGMTNGAIK